MTKIFRSEEKNRTVTVNNKNSPTSSTSSVSQRNYYLHNDCLQVALMEHVDSPMNTRRPFKSCPSSPIMGSRRRRSFDEGDKSAVKRSPNGELYPLFLPSPILGRKNRQMNNLLISGGPSGESRRSSGASSIPEVIEECESDEEIDGTTSNGNESIDYIRCINCSRSNSIDSIDRLKLDSHQPQQITNYCHNCRHLNHNPHLPAFYEGRRSSWTAGEKYCYSPRNSRKSSLASSTSELPSIFEPSFDDETDDTIELQLSVKQEVDKLLKLNNNNNNINNKNSSPIYEHAEATTDAVERKRLLMLLRETHL